MSIARSIGMLIGAFGAGVFLTVLLTTPSARTIDRAHKNGYADGLAACKGPSRLERAAKWVGQ